MFSSMSAAPEERAPTLAVDPQWQRRWSLEEYHRMIAAGVLDEDDRVELLEGIVVAMSPQDPPHATVVALLNRLLVRALGDELEVRPQLPLTLARSEPEPDLAVVDRRRSYQRHPDTALLVIEVADSTLAKDRLKARVYAEAAVTEYWIVNLVDRCVEVMRRPDPRLGSYQDAARALPGERLAASSLPGVVVDVTALFDR
jgi:Uma2 family endonuclease